MKVWFLVLVVVGHHAVAVTTIPIGSSEQCLREAKLYNDTTGYRASCTRGMLK